MALFLKTVGLATRVPLFCRAASAASVTATPSFAHAALLDSACDKIAIERKPLEEVLRQLRASATFRDDALVAGAAATGVASLFAERLHWRASELLPDTFADDEMHDSGETDSSSSDGDDRNGSAGRSEAATSSDTLSASVLDTHLDLLWPASAQECFRTCDQVLAMSHAALKLHFATHGADSGTGLLDLQLSAEVQKTPVGRRIARRFEKSDGSSGGRRRKNRRTTVGSGSSGGDVTSVSAAAATSSNNEPGGFGDDAAYLWGPQSHSAAICCQQLDQQRELEALLIDADAGSDSLDMAAGGSSEAELADESRRSSGTAVGDAVVASLQMVAEVSERRALCGPVHVALYPWLVQWAQAHLPGVDAASQKRVLDGFDTVHSNMQMRAELSAPVDGGDSQGTPNAEEDEKEVKRAEELRVLAGVQQRAAAEGLVALVQLADAVADAIVAGEQGESAVSTASAAIDEKNGESSADSSESTIFRNAVRSMIRAECQAADLLQVRSWALAKLERADAPVGAS